MKKYVSWIQYVKNDLNESQKKNGLYVMMVVIGMVI
jgi:hypothetical protein